MKNLYCAEELAKNGTAFPSTFEKNKAKAKMGTEKPKNKGKKAKEVEDLDIEDL